MRGILVCVREYQHMCPHTAMYVCRYGIALYTHGRTQPSGRGSNLVHMYHTARADTGEGFTGQTRDTKSGGGGGGEGGLYASDPLSTPVRYIYSMVKVISLWGVEPSTPHPPLRRIRHVVTQWCVLLFLIMCAYGLAVYNVK